MNSQHPFKWRHFQQEIILLNVSWYLRYPLSYRNLEEMMKDRGLEVDLLTIGRWVLAYAPEIDERTRRHILGLVLTDFVVGENLLCRLM